MMGGYITSDYCDSHVEDIERSETTHRLLIEGSQLQSLLLDDSGNILSLWDILCRSENVQNGPSHEYKNLTNTDGINMPVDSAEKIIGTNIVEEEDGAMGLEDVYCGVTAQVEDWEQGQIGMPYCHDNQSTRQTGSLKQVSTSRSLN